LGSTPTKKGGGKKSTDRTITKQSYVVKKMKNQHYSFTRKKFQGLGERAIWKKKKKKKGETGEDQRVLKTAWMYQKQLEGGKFFM